MTRLTFLLLLFTVTTAPANSAPTALLPLIDGKPMELPLIEQLFIGAEPMPLQQAWQDKLEAGFQGGFVRMRWEPSALWVYAVLQDAYLDSDAKGLNERLWEKGDTFEVFLHLEGQPHYYEYHVAPTGAVLQLAFPVGVAREDRFQFERWLREPLEIGSTHWVDDKQGLWRLLVRIPSAAIKDGKPFTPGDQLHFSFCRYDYKADTQEPLLSSTTLYQELNFHRLDDWRHCVFEPAPTPKQ